MSRAHPVFRVHLEPMEQLERLEQLGLLEVKDRLVSQDSQDLPVPLDLRDSKEYSELLDRVVPPEERDSLEELELVEPSGRPVRRDKLDLRVPLVHKEHQARPDLLERLEMSELPDLPVVPGQLVWQDLLALRGTWVSRDNRDRLVNQVKLGLLDRLAHLALRVQLEVQVRPEQLEVRVKPDPQVLLVQLEAKVSRE